MAAKAKGKKLRPEDPHFVEQLAEAFPFCGYIEGAEYRGITHLQLKLVITYALDNCGAWRDLDSRSKTAGEALSSDILNLHHINDWLISPATRQHNCSCVELFTKTQQKPDWFISHFWGEKVVDFLECVGEYIYVRNLRASAVFWVCAYANRQHSLDPVFAADRHDMCLYKAMKLSQGVLLILDGQTLGNAGTGPSTAFTRTWCIFELSIAVMYLNKSIDIASCKDGTVDILTQGLTHDEEEIDSKREGFGRRNKVKRESTFPVAILRTSLDINVEKTDTSLEADQSCILNCIAHSDDFDSAPPRNHENYAMVNAELRAHFARSMWFNTVEHQGSEVEQLASALLANEWRTSLAMNFDFCTKMDDAQLSVLSQGLSSQLLTLELHFGSCESISNRGLEVLSKALPEKLETLVLNFQGCINIGSAGITSLGKRLEALRSLKVLRLNFGWNKTILSVRGVTEGLANLTHLTVFDLNLALLDQLNSKEVIAMAKAVPQTLKTLNMSFSHCDRLDDCTVQAIADRLPSSLTVLKLNFKGCKQITHLGVEALAQHLPEDLLSLHFNFEDCASIGEPAIATLVQSLPTTLYGAKLNLQGTALSSEKQKICRRLDRMRQWKPFVPRLDSKAHKKASISIAAGDTLLLRSINTIVVANSPTSGSPPVHAFSAAKGDSAAGCAASEQRPRSMSSSRRSKSAATLGVRPQSSQSRRRATRSSSGSSFAVEVQEEKALAGTLHRYFHDRTSVFGWNTKTKPIVPRITRPVQPPPSMCWASDPEAMFLHPRTLFQGLSEPLWRP